MDLNLAQLSWVMFYNKRDLAEESIAPVEVLDSFCDPSGHGAVRYAGDSISGTNVFNALNYVTQRVLRDFMMKDDLENFEAYR